MRLIDADELLRRLNDRSIEFNANINDVILEQPTAYDVDKVVEKIGLMKLDDGCIGCMLTPNATIKIIDIVKRGGIDAK